MPDADETAASTTATARTSVLGGSRLKTLKKRAAEAWEAAAGSGTDGGVATDREESEAVAGGGGEGEVEAEAAAEEGEAADEDEEEDAGEEGEGDDQAEREEEAEEGTHEGAAAGGGLPKIERKRDETWGIHRTPPLLLSLSARPPSRSC